MLLIDCPYCGGRAQTEFAYYGEAHIVRPSNPDALSDAEWAEYLFLRTNPKGVHFERWMHAHGCRRFFNMIRDTVSGEIFATYLIGESKPAAIAESATAGMTDIAGMTATASADNGDQNAAGGNDNE